MPEGGCFCGKVRIKYSGDVQMTALCHCADCRKITGSTYSTNIVVGGDHFSVSSGSPKKRTTTADSGKSITSTFCGDCGSTLFRQGDSFGDSVVVKVGVMDDSSEIGNAKPGAELYAHERVSWVAPIAGAQQLKGMPGSEEL